VQCRVPSKEEDDEENPPKKEEEEKKKIRENKQIKRLQQAVAACNLI
jgi:hypothetical protein